MLKQNTAYFFLILISSAAARLIYTPNSVTSCLQSSCTETIYGERTFYQKNGEWYKINTTLWNNGTHWIGDKNEFKTVVNNNKISLYGADESYFYFDLPWVTGAPVIKDNVVTYTINTQGATKVKGTLTLTLTAQGVTKLIKIDSITTNGNNPWKYSENLAKALAKNRFNTENLRVWYVASNATDTWNVYYPAEWNFSNTSIDFELNKSWFLNAVYPIYIDPDVTYTFSTYSATTVAYGNSLDSGTVAVADGVYDMVDPVDPTWAEGWGAVSNFTTNGYNTLSVLDSSYANISSGKANGEPFARYNFTVKPSSSINWMNVTLVQKTGGTTGVAELCWFRIANYTEVSWMNLSRGAETSRITQSRNFTSNSDIVKFVTADNIVTLLSFGTSLDLPNVESCMIDTVYVLLNYNATTIFTNIANNNSNPNPGNFVNLTTTITTTYDSLSGYIFSSNFSGSWVNSSFIPTTGGTVSAWNTSTMGAAGFYQWMFYANSSTNVFNYTPLQSLTVSDVVVSDWWNTSFAYRTNCTVNSSVFSTLTNYPAYCILDTATLISAGKMQSSCADIRVISAETKVLPIEVENRTCNTGSTIIWFKNATTPAGNNRYNIYYGNSTATATQQRTNVWENYVSVWHGDSYNDVLAVNNLTYYGEVYPVTNATRCKFGFCFSFNGNLGSLTNSTPAQYPSGSKAYTITQWVWTNQTPTCTYLSFSGYGQWAAFGKGRILYWDLATPQIQLNIWGGVLSKIGVPAEQWNQNKTFVGGNIADTSHINVWVNTTKGNDDSYAISTVANRPLYIGSADNTSWAGQCGNETFDEIRLSNVSRSNDWMKADYGQL